MSSFNKPDYYQILGVSRNASDQEIRAQYRILALKFHPDREKSMLAKQMMALINEAYEVLSDPQKRRDYDSNINTNVSENTVSEDHSTEAGFYNNDFTNSKFSKRKKIILQMKVVGKKIFDAVETFAKNYQANLAKSNSKIDRDDTLDYSRTRRVRERPQYEEDIDDYEEDYQPKRKTHRKSRTMRKSRNQYDDWSPFEVPDYDLEGFFRKW